jgi:hypothetical protein
MRWSHGWLLGSWVGCGSTPRGGDSRARVDDGAGARRRRLTRPAAMRRGAGWCGPMIRRWRCGSSSVTSARARRTAGCDWPGSMGPKSRPRTAGPSTAGGSACIDGEPLGRTARPAEKLVSPGPWPERFGKLARRMDGTYFSSSSCSRRGRLGRRVALAAARAAGEHGARHDGYRGRVVDRDERLRSSGAGDGRRRCSRGRGESARAERLDSARARRVGARRGGPALRWLGDRGVHQRAYRAVVLAAVRGYVAEPRRTGEGTGTRTGSVWLRAVLPR